MKYLLPAFLLCFFMAESIFAQTVFYPRVVPGSSVFGFEHYQFDANYSALQSQMPYEFRFLYNDQYLQALSNSAKTAFVEGNQVYTSIDPGADDNFTVLAIWDQSWLAGFSIFNNYLDSDFNRSQSYANSEDVISGTTRIIEQQMDSSFDYSISERPRTELEFRLAKVLASTENSARSLGLRFGWNKDSRTEDGRGIDTYDLFYERYESGVIDRREIVQQNRTDDFARNTKNNTIILALEYSSAHERGETYHTVSAQFSEGDDFRGERRADVRYYSREQFQYGPDTVYVDITEREVVQNRVNRFERSPVLFGYEGYANRQLNWLGNDYLFIGLAGFYSFGESTISENYSNTVSYFSPDTTRQGSSYNLDPTKSDEWAFFGRISAGYAVQIQANDLSFFTGVNPYFEYMKSNSYAVSGALIGTESSIYRLIGIIPLFAEYKLNDFISLTGGGIAQFSYTNQENLNKLATPFQAQNVNNWDSFDSEDQSSQFSQTQRTFFGFKASHDSGLRLAADIRGDLTRLSDWFVTVGYVF